MSVKNQVGPYISACNDIIDRLAKQAAPNILACYKLQLGFENILSDFLRGLDHFNLTEPAESNLRKSHLYEDLKELIEILKGTSDLYPIASFKCDSNGESYAELTEEEKLWIRSQMCAGVATKIINTLSELIPRESDKIARDDLAERITTLRIIEPPQPIKAHVIVLVSRDPLELENFPMFQDDKDVVLAAVKNCSWALKFASNALQNDYEVVSEGIKEYYDCLEFASDALRNNKQLILEAIKLSPFALQYASNALKNDKELIMEAIRRTPIQFIDNMLRYIGIEMRPFALAFIEVMKNAYFLITLDSIFKNDRDLVFEAVRRNGRVFQFINSIFKDDLEIALESIRQDAFNIIYVGMALKKDNDSLEKILAINPETAIFIKGIRSVYH